MLIPFQAFIFYEWSVHCNPIPVFITAIPAMRTGFPVMKTGFSLWEKLQREIPVFITGMRFASVILLHYFCFKNSCRLKVPQMFSQQRAKFYWRNKKKLSLYKSNNTNILEKTFSRNHRSGYKNWNATQELLYSTLYNRNFIPRCFSSVIKKRTKRE